MQAGAKAMLKDSKGLTPLHLSTIPAEPAAMEELLKAFKKDALNAQDNEGMTTLAWAAYQKRPNHVRLLIERQAREDIADINKKVITCLALSLAHCSCSIRCTLRRRLAAPCAASCCSTA